MNEPHPTPKILVVDDNAANRALAKNPVSTLDLCAQALLRDRELPERSRLMVQRIRADLRSLLHKLLNLLDISRSDEGGLVPRKDEVRLSELFEQVVHDLQLRAQTATVHLAPSSAALCVTADASLLLRVLENLVDNAIRHAPEGTEVRMTARMSEGSEPWVKIQVADQGVGIQPEVRSRIFEPFVQLEQGTRVPERTGRGLGLTFCKVAVEAHGGRIWIEDAHPGAAFCLTLPQPDRAQTPEAEHP